jgi:hypothetical protein
VSLEAVGVELGDFGKLLVFSVSALMTVLRQGDRAGVM